MFLIIFIPKSQPMATPTANRPNPIECAQPTSGPRLSYSSCRYAVSEFLQRFPDRQERYKLTHNWRPFARYTIKCPYVINYDGCVFTLDFKVVVGVVSIRTGVAAFGGQKLARACVGKEGVDGGDVEWSAIDYVVRISLGHSAQPLSGLYGNETSGVASNTMLETIDAF